MLSDEEIIETVKNDLWTYEEPWLDLQIYFRARFQASDLDPSTYSPGGWTAWPGSLGFELHCIQVDRMGRFVFSDNCGSEIPEVGEDSLWIHGRIKWDNCSDIHFFRDGYEHFCNAHEFDRLASIMKKVYEFASGVHEDWIEY